jgi:hypothetical protein
MGEDKWIRREPGSISGSMVPPPAEPGKPRPEPGASPLPKRQPKSRPQPSRPQQSKPQPDVPPSIAALPSVPAGASGPAGLAGRKLYVARSTQAPLQAAQLRAAQPQAAEPLGIEPFEVPLTEPPATESPLPESPLPESPPPVPDNVRYLVRPVPAQPNAESDQQDPPRAGRRAAPAGLRPDEGGGPSAAADSTRPGRLRRPLTVAAAVSLILVTAIGTAFVLVRHNSSAPATRASSGTGPVTRGGHATATGARALTGLSNAAITRSRAASWIVREISRSAIIACDDVMCGQLFNAGLPASNLVVLSPTATDPLGADLVISTPALRSQFGRRLAKVYAPLTIASFGSGMSRVQVRVVAPDGAAAYQLALNHDLIARQHAGGTLLRNSEIEVAAPAQPELTAGLVDPRLLVMLPVLATQHPVDVLGFYDQAPHASKGVPLTGVELAASDGAAGMSARDYRHWLLTFLNGQRSP